MTVVLGRVMMIFVVIGRVARGSVAGRCEHLRLSVHHVSQAGCLGAVRTAGAGVRREHCEQKKKNKTKPSMRNENKSRIDFYTHI